MRFQLPPHRWISIFEKFLAQEGLRHMVIGVGIVERGGTTVYKNVVVVVDRDEEYHYELELWWRPVRVAGLMDAEIDDARLKVGLGDGDLSLFQNVKNILDYLKRPAYEDAKRFIEINYKKFPPYNK